MTWLNLDTWIISDTHFGHANIIKYCNRPENSDELIADNWNRAVGRNDHVLHLGDIGWHGKPIPKLSGKVHYIPGNHDSVKDRKLFDAMGWEKLGQIVVLSKDNLPHSYRYSKVVFSHYPLPHGTHSLNIHGHIHNNGYHESMPSEDKINVSIEVMDYKPKRLKDVLGI
jgi:calcineurin-like phosphoesterase family protein